jgi:hypothetical protein
MGRVVRTGSLPLTMNWATLSPEGKAIRVSSWASLIEHLVVDAMVTSAQTNSSVPVVGASLLLPCSRAAGAQHAKLAVDLHTSSPLITSYTQSVLCCSTYPFSLRMGGGWPLFMKMAVVLVDCFATLVAVRYGCGINPYVAFWHICSHEGVFRRSTHVPFRASSLGMCAASSCTGVVF